MLFKIVVFKNQKFIFSTNPDDMRSIFDVAEVFKLLDAKFPETEGFIIEVCVPPMKFSRQTWQRLLPQIQSMDKNTITMIFLTK